MLKKYTLLLLLLICKACLQYGYAQKTFDVQSYNVIDTVGPYTSPLHAEALSPDTKYVAGSGEDNNVIIWRADSNKVIRRLKGHKKRVNALAYSSNGQYLASASADGTVILWDVAKGKAWKTFASDGMALGKGQSINFICFDKDDKNIIFGGDDKKLTRIHNPLAGATSSSLAGTAEPILCGAYSPDHKWFAFTSASLIYLLNTATNELKVIAGSNDVLTSVSFRPDNKILATRCKNRTIEFWDLKTDNIIKTIKPNSNVRGEDNTPISYSPDGKYLIAGSMDGSPAMYDMDDYTFLYSLRGHHKAVRSLEFSRDGRLVTTASDDSTIRVWYLADAVLLAEESKIFNNNTDQGDKGRKTKPNPNDTSKLESHVTYNAGKIPLALNGRKITASRPVEVSDKHVSLYVWDDDQVDGDIISLNFNGKWVLNAYKLNKKKKVVNVVLDEHGNNFLMLYAHNEGDTPPNTAGISIYDGVKETRLILKSDLKSCDAVRLILK